MMTIQLSDLQAALFWNGAIMLALLLLLLVQWREMKRLQLDLLSGFVVIAVFNTAVLLGARLGAVEVTSWKALFTDGTSLYTSGKTIVGGLLLAIPVFWILKKYWKLNGRHADALFIALPLAAAVPRIGCAAAGCCYGEITDSFFSWTYGPGMPAYDWQLEHHLIGAGAGASLPVYPVQALFVLANLLLFALLWKLRRRLKMAGSMALLVIALLFINRFWIEFFRDISTDRGLLGITFLGLKSIQWFCLITGILLLFLFRRHERSGVQVPLVKVDVPLINITMTLLVVTVILLAFRPLFSVDEALVLLISLFPGMGLLLRQLWLNWKYQSRKLATTSLLSLTGALMMFTSVDTIPLPQKGDQWITVGAGGTFGSYSYIDRDCDGNVVDNQQLTLRSTGYDIAYHNKFSHQTNGGLGFHGSFGSVRSDNSMSGFNYNFHVYGPYLFLDNRLVGLKGGPLFNKPHDLPGIAPKSIPNRDWHFKLRIGARHSYFFDIRYLDYPGVHIYPQPEVSVGFVNWGFLDRSGMTSIGLGLAEIQGETGGYLNGKIPIRKLGLQLESALYIHNDAIYTLGIKYRFGIGSKNQKTKNDNN